MSEQEQIKNLTNALEHAIKIIESYQLDIRIDGYANKGFCQGIIYKKALQDIENLRKGVRK